MTWALRFWCWVWRHDFSGGWKMLEYGPDAFDMVIECQRCGKTSEKHFRRSQGPRPTEVRP